MLKRDVLKHFKGRVTLVAATVGVSRDAVYKWPRRIPEKSALKLERATGGALKFNPEDYPARRSISPAQEVRQA